VGNTTAVGFALNLVVHGEQLGGAAADDDRRDPGTRVEVGVLAFGLSHRLEFLRVGFRDFVGYFKR
jgi:hypothetical protein